MPRRRATLWLLALPLLGACATSGPQMERGEAYALPGPYEVETLEDVVLQDARRSKDLHLRILVPMGEGSFPVIVFSHGTGGSKDQYLPLTELWASHGYVVLQPSHGDPKEQGAQANGKPPREWETRPADVTFVLDSLDELERREPSLGGKLDRTRIGVGGHSAGAGTTLIVAGAKVFTGNRELSFADPRLRAAVALAPPGTNKTLTRGSWGTVKMPLLVMGGSRDVPVRGDTTAESRLEVYEHAAGGDKYRIWVEGMGHPFGGIQGEAFLHGKVKNEGWVRYTRVATLAFWDAYLKHDRAARRYLRSGALPASSRGELRLDWH